MSKVINATFIDGVFKPDEPLKLPPQTRVKLMIVDPIVEERSPEEVQKAWEEFDQVCEEISIDSSEPIMTRDQLHERR
jgi:predicted DNA-binding antitoxin AbrB/MazE fold protein